MPLSCGCRDAMSETATNARQSSAVDPLSLSLSRVCRAPSSSGSRLGKQYIPAASAAESLDQGGIHLLLILLILLFHEMRKHLNLASSLSLSCLLFRPKNPCAPIPFLPGSPGEPTTQQQTDSFRPLLMSRGSSQCDRDRQLERERGKG